MTEQELAAMNAGKSKKNQSPNTQSPNNQSFGNAIDVGDMSHVGVQLADNACLTIYNAFNQRMEVNLAAMRSHLSAKTISISAPQKALPSSGSFIDSLWGDVEVIDEG